jgi:hypothetical protein
MSQPDARSLALSPDYSRRRYGAMLIPVRKRWPEETRSMGFVNLPMTAAPA